MKKISIMALGCLLISVSAHAALIVDGDFTSAVVVDNDNGVRLSEVDGGWVAKNAVNNGGWVVSSGAAVSQAGNTTEFGIGQVNTVGAEAGHLITVSFDWTAAVGATGDDLNLVYGLAGWVTPTALTVAGDRFSIHNDISGTVGTTSYRTDGANGDWVAHDLLGDTAAANISGPEHNTVVGIAGTTVNYSLVIDISGNTSAASDLSDLDYFGFFASAMSATAAGGTLDNVTVTVIPEPAALGLIAFSGLGILMIRRRLAM